MSDYDDKTLVRQEGLDGRRGERRRRRRRWGRSFYLREKIKIKFPSHPSNMSTSTPPPQKYRTYLPARRTCTSDYIFPSSQLDIPSPYIPSSSSLSSSSFPNSHFFLFPPPFPKKSFTTGPSSVSFRPITSNKLNLQPKFKFALREKRQE